MQHSTLEDLAVGHPWPALILLLLLAAAVPSRVTVATVVPIEVLILRRVPFLEAASLEEVVVSFFALHTHRSGRTASDSRSRLFPATQLVAMHSLKSSCRSASPKKPQKPNHNRTTGTTTETAQQPQPQQQQQNRNPATTTTSNNKTRNESNNRQRTTTTTNETGGRQQHQQQRTNTAPKRETRNPEQTPKQLHT